MRIRREAVVIRSLGVALAGNLFLPGTAGRWPALLLCHGAGEHKENYDEFGEFLAEEGVAALALDMHGHGASEGERYHVRMDQWVGDVGAALEFLATHPELNPDQLGAFGLSSGGTAILEAALVEPRLKFLVLLGATVRNPLPWLPSLLLRTLTMLGQLKRALTGSDLRVSLLWMAQRLTLASDPEIDRQIKSDARCAAAYAHFPVPGASQAFFVDTLRRLHRIKAPTLVLWGQEDQLDPPANAQRLFEALECRKRLRIIPGNGHMGHRDRNRAEVFGLTAEWVRENLGRA